MDSQELLKKVKRIQIITHRMVDEILAGEYHSAFKGQGMEFDEVREYQVGDDIRTIDWNVTARTGISHVKTYKEEREITIYLVIDISGSLDFGSHEKNKRQLAIEIAAVLALAAIKNNDKVGLILFSDQIEKFIPARKGRHSVLRIIREMAGAQAKSQQTDITQALEFLLRVQSKKAVVFLISDFLGSDYRKSLQRAASRHDVIAVTSQDQRERKIPAIGLVELEDAESGERILVDSSSHESQNILHKNFDWRERKRKELFQRSKVDELSISTERDYLKDIHRLFRQRSLKRR